VGSGLIYLDDSYQREMEAEIAAIVPEAEGRWRMILDQTVFYPMGGGQATDQGKLQTDSWEGQVYQVLVKEGRVNHYVKADQPPPQNGSVHGTLDWERRYRNMRLHSAGHMVDFALFRLGYTPKPLQPIKADHGKKPYILYQGICEKEIRSEVEKESNLLVERGLALSTRFAELEEIEQIAIYLQPGLPKNKPLRILTLEGVGSVADGGTQVLSSSEVGKISIPKIEIIEGFTKVHYRIQEPS